jgi:hypothetical protein
MVLDELEQAVLALFFKSEEIKASSDDLSKIEVDCRDLTGAGLITQLKPNQLKILKGPSSFTGGRVGAKLNRSVDVGFVVYIQDGYVEAVEGYTEEGEWPKDIKLFDLKLIKFSGQKN